VDEAKTHSFRSTKLNFEIKLRWSKTIKKMIKKSEDGRITPTELTEQLMTKYQDIVQKEMRTWIEGNLSQSDFLQLIDGFYISK
jgi:hypothetical protein